MMAKAIIVALAITTAFGAVISESPETVEVALSQGRLEGVREGISDSRFFYSFRGVPYAAPPVGDLRFRDPVTAEPWSGVRKGLTPPPCAQIRAAAYLGKTNELDGEEDCLYLHVYTPKLNAADLPVMVFIHGGSFYMGNADAGGGLPRPLLEKDIVLVSIQYRLGTFGFLSTGDSVMPGNLGLKDQSFALKWVHENINKFGGDHNTVTIFGVSSGSSSTHYQILTPYAAGYFQRAILQAGTALSPWALRDDHREKAIKIAKGFNCPGADQPSPDSNQLLQCFKNRTVEELASVAIKDMVLARPFFMGPRIDGDYLPAHPAQILKDGSYNKVDLISGVNQHEGALFFLGILENEATTAKFNQDFNHAAPIMIGMDLEDDSVYLTHRGFYHYVGDTKVTKDNIVEVQKLFADTLINVGHDEITQLHEHDSAYGKRIYRYENQLRPQRSYLSYFSYATNVTSSWVAHGDDITYVSDVPLLIPEITRRDHLFQRNIMVDLWTNFARTGNPTPDLKLGFKWEPMKSKDDLRFLSLTPAPRMMGDNRAENREFWRNMPLKMNKVLFPERFA